MSVPDPASASAGVATNHQEIGVGILNRIREAVIATDLQGHIILWNRFAEELYGWSPEDVIGSSIVDVLAPDLREESEQILNRLRGGEVWTGEFTVQHRGGRRFVARVSDTPLRDSQGVIFGIVGFSTALDTPSRQSSGSDEVAVRASRSASPRRRPAKAAGRSSSPLVRLGGRNAHTADELWHLMLAYSIGGVLKGA